MMKPPALTRRDFLESGLLVFFVADIIEAQEPARRPARPGYPTDFNAYLKIAADNRVTCMVGKVELGQGSMTALPQLLAEELDVALESVDIIMGDTDQCPWDMGTFGSLSIRQFGPVLRAAGAEARAVLLEMAAERLNAPVARLQVHSGIVTDPQEDKRVTYGELVDGKRIERHLGNVAPKTARQFNVIGQSPVRKDALEKVTGKAKYAGDIQLPGMLHARILRPPAHGATLASVDTTAVEKIDGVRVIKDGSFVAVLHEHPDVADHALALVKAQFSPPSPGIDDKTVFEHLLKNAPAPQLVHEAGDIVEGLKLATTVLEHSYLNSYVAHAPLETHSAVATVEGSKITVWASTQTRSPFNSRSRRRSAVPRGMCG